MKRFIAIAAATCALVFAATAAAALEPGVYDPGNTGCPVATYANGVLHLEKNCPTPTNAAAGADITGLNGQTFHVRVVHAREHEPVPGRLAALRRCHDRLACSSSAATTCADDHGNAHVLVHAATSPRPATSCRSHRHDHRRSRRPDRRPGHGRHLEHHGQRRPPGRPGRPADLEGPVQAPRVEELQQPAVQESGAVRQLPRAPLQSRADQAQAQPEAPRALVPLLVPRRRAFGPSALLHARTFR